MHKINKWLDEKNWYTLPNSEEAILYKKQAFHCLMLMPSMTTNCSQEQINQLNFIFQDIDFTTFICERYYFQYFKFSTLSQFNILISDIDKARFIIKHDCLDEIFEYIISKHPTLKLEKDTAFTVLSTTNHKRKALELFSVFTNDMIFINEIINNGYKDFIKLLEKFPQNIDFTRQALIHHLLPNQFNRHLYNSMIYEDIPFILDLLQEPNGYSLYYELPDSLQNNKTICETVLSQHPHIKVKYSLIHSIKDFKQFYNSNNINSIDYSSLANSFLEYFHICDTTHKKVELISYFSNIGVESYIDLMGDPQFDGHEIQNFFQQCAKEDSFFQNFNNSEHGEIIFQEIKNYDSFRNYELTILPQIGKWLNTYYLKYTLDNIPHKSTNTLQYETKTKI